ncbi:DNA polymerase Y family protein [Actinomyces gaoshouyii]|uniref:DNA repair nucleotidyltransferase n=1 Tax=Actinomyces gaoshouyii TaxID=1960083 RepID=A0A8H9H8U4_9ACTO|nr:DNA polymerase Y family protein [Actinomyces gaoshouyii]GGO97538.1 DNA repair nucleotidyltransferase [Actinomyces gaoshouyii]
MSPSPPPTPTVPRLLAVWVPDWPVVALTLQARDQARARRGSGESPPDPATGPVAVIGARGVVAASPAARAAGVGIGMRLRLARSLCPGLAVIPPCPEREARAFGDVMEALTTVLADPSIVRPGLALSGARGPAAWAGGEKPLAEAVIEAVAQGIGVECQVGIADSLLGAVLAARRGIIVSSGATADFLSPWPMPSALAALTSRAAGQEAKAVIETLSRLGIHRLGDLARLPRRDIAARFGITGERLHLLASAEARDAPRAPRPRASIGVEERLDPPIERADAAAFVARGLAERLASRLAGAGLGAGRLLIEAGCEDGSELARSWILDSFPDPSWTTDRVRWQIEGWLAGRSGRPPAAPLTLLRLTALEPVVAGAHREGLWGTPGERGQRLARRAAERVESLLGVGGVLSPRLVPGRDPRSRARLIGWDESPAGPSPVGRPGGAAREGTPPWAGMLPEPSPATVPCHRVPAVLADAMGEEIGVDAQGILDGAPAAIRIGEPGSPHSEWDGSDEVLAWAGPWVIDEGWWGPGAHRRAYLQVTRRCGPPLLLERSGRWWLDAVYD